MIRQVLQKILRRILGNKELESTFDNVQLPQSAKIYLIDKTNKVIQSSFAEQFNKDDYEKALEKAWHNRDFEIEMYWKRAAYFWTFIGATLLGYFALIGSKGYHENLKEEYYHIEIFIITIGVVFSEAWHFVNKGSKRWQENWEAQIDELENLVGRPSYTTIFYKPGYYSVSRINQTVSLIVSRIWMILFCIYWVRYYNCYLPWDGLYNEALILNIISFSTVFIIGWFVHFLYRKAPSGINEEAEIIKTANSKIGNKFFFSRDTKNRK